VSVNILWQMSMDASPIQYPYHIFADKNISSSHDRLFYIWDGDTIPGFPCSRHDSAFLTLDLRTGEVINHYAGDETLSIKSMIASEFGFTVVSHDKVVTQFDSNGNRLWGNQSFGSRTIKNIFETNTHYYLPNSRFSYVVDKHNGQKQDNLGIPNVIAVYEDIILASDIANEIQIRDQNRQDILDAFPFAIGTDGFGFKPFVTRHKNILILTQLYQGIQAYDLEQDAVIWSLNLPFLENEYPSVIGDKLIVYDKSYPSLGFYDIRTGEYIGQIQLANNVSNIAPEYVDIVSDENIIVIYFQNTHDIVALEVNF